MIPEIDKLKKQLLAAQQREQKHKHWAYLWKECARSFFLTRRVYRSLERECADTLDRLDAALQVDAELRLALEIAEKTMVAAQTHKDLARLPGAVHVANEALRGTSKRCFSLRESDMRLRRLLWEHHASGHGLYGDDGEMQCNTCLLDFKRDSIEQIESVFLQARLREMGVLE